MDSNGGRGGGGEVLVPAESGAERRQFLPADLVVDLLGIAPRNQVERTLGQGGFDLHHRGGIGLGLAGLLAGQLQHALDVRHVFLAQLDGLGVVLQVVVAVGKAQAALIELRDHRVGVFEVLAGAELEQRPDANGVQVGDFFGDLRLVLEVADAVQFRLERREASGVDSLFVHAGGVVIADLLGGGVAIGGGLGGVFQDLVQDLAVPFGQLTEASPHGLVRGDGISS